jgi:hypothetical protein
MQPLINGKSYDWASITCLLAGAPIVGITSIDYDEAQVKDDNMGAGNRPVARGYGNIKPEGCSIEVYAEEAEAIGNRAPNGNILEIAPFEIIVSYRNGAAITTHILKNCEFTKNSRSNKQGETSIKVTLPLIVSHILWKKV